MPLQWRHKGRDSVSNHQPHDCVLNRLFRRRSEKTSKLRVTGHLCGELTSPRWIPRTNGQLRGKCFHLMTSCWHRLELVGKVWWAIYKIIEKISWNDSPGKTPSPTTVVQIDYNENLMNMIDCFSWKKWQDGVTILHVTIARCDLCKFVTQLLNY